MVNPERKQLSRAVLLALIEESPRLKLYILWKDQNYRDPRGKGRGIDSRFNVRVTKKAMIHYLRVELAASDRMIAVLDYGHELVIL